MLTVASGRRAVGGILEANPEICSAAFQLGGVAGGWGLPRAGISRWSPSGISGSSGGERGRAHWEEAGPVWVSAPAIHSRDAGRLLIPGTGLGWKAETCLPSETLLWSPPGSCLRPSSRWLAFLDLHLRALVTPYL